MRILITMIDGSSKKGSVEETTLVADLSQRIKIPADCCLTLAGVPLEGDRTLGEYGISNGMELEVERLGGAATAQRIERMTTEKKPKITSKMDIAGKGKAGKATGKLANYIQAAKTGDLAALQQMIMDGQKVNEVCPFTSLSAVSAAAGGGHTQVLAFLIENGGDVGKSEFNHFPPVHAAAAKGCEEELNMLLDAGADIDVLEDMLGQAALHAAIDRNKSSMLRILLARGADINVVNKMGVTPLGHACAKGDAECVQLLIANKATLRTETDQGVSPLGAAVKKGCTEIVGKLLAAGVPVDGSALYAALETKNETLEIMLLDAGASPTSYNLDGKSALHQAAHHGSAEICAYLADQGFDVNRKDSKGITPLMEAARGGHKGVTRFLLSRQADAHSVDNDGNSALHVAGWFEKPKVFEILVKVGGGDPEKTNNAGDKPRSPNPGDKCCVM